MDGRTSTNDDDKAMTMMQMAVAEEKRSLLSSAATSSSTTATGGGGAHNRKFYHYLALANHHHPPRMRLSTSSPSGWRLLVSDDQQEDEQHPQQQPTSSSSTRMESPSSSSVSTPAAAHHPTTVQTSGGGGRRSFNEGTIIRPSNGDLPRRYSGSGAKTPDASSASSSVGGSAKGRRLSPNHNQQHRQHKACSLVVVSPTAVVTRSPSQQWLRHSASPSGITTTNISLSSNAMPHSTAPPQTEPPPPSSGGGGLLAPVDPHRPPPPPIPGQVPPGGGGGGVHNPLYNVSNEFMRVAGYSQQFKRLLSKRDGPPPPGKGGSQDGQDVDVEKGVLGMVASDHPEQAALALALGGAGGQAGALLIAQQQNSTDSKGDGVKKEPLHLDPNRPTRKSAYGRLWKEQPNLKHRLKMRKQLFTHRTKVSDFALLFAVAGMLLTILEAELTASGIVAKSEYASLLLRSLIVATTLVLVALVVWYHSIETKISVIDSGAEDWRVAITYDRLWQCALEVAVCSVCPFPANVNVTWDRLKADHRTPYSVAVPLDAVLSVPMFLRTYLFGRFMALHSRQFQDAATRSIAALNHIAVNFTFVLKTLMHEHPLRVLIIFTVAFWITMSWILTQCERYVSSEGEESGENNHYLNSIWFVIITFMSIGYGDIVPNTYCGRALAITTGIVGAGVSSALIAVISRKLELSRAEKHVNQFMTDSKLTRQRKEAAASVLQHTWFIHKYKNIPKAKDDMKLRMHQRRFLAAINEFRRVKWDQRKLAEQGNALVDVAKLQSDMHETLWDMQQNQDHLVAQMDALMNKMQELQDIIIAQQHQHQQQQQQIHVRRAPAVSRQYSLHPIGGGGCDGSEGAPAVVQGARETPATPMVLIDDDEVEELNGGGGAVDTSTGGVDKDEPGGKMVML